MRLLSTAPLLLLCTISCAGKLEDDPSDDTSSAGGLSVESDGEQGPAKETGESGGASSDDGGSGGSDDGGSGGVTGSDRNEARVGATYIFTVPPENWSPAAVGLDLGVMVPPFLVQVESRDELIFGTAEMSGEAQQMCNPTSRMSATGSSISDLSTEPTDVPIYVVNSGTPQAPIEPPVPVLVTGYAFSFTNLLSTSAGEAVGALSVTLDMRELYPLFTQIIGVTSDAVCGALDSLAVPCEPCADDEVYCLTMTAKYLRVESFDGDLVEVSSAPATCFD